MELFQLLFSSLLLFVYHCFDRIVINGYLSTLTRPENVVYFFRNVLGFHAITPEVLRQRTNDYQRWVESYAGNRKIPIEWAEKGVRKEDYVRPMLRRMERENQHGVYFIFKSMEQGQTFRSALPRFPTDDPDYRILRKTRTRFSHYYFYLRDETLGPLVMRVASFFPFHTTYYLNGHSFIEKELTRARVQFRKNDNAFLAVSDPKALQEAADRLRPELIRNRLEYWTERNAARDTKLFRLDDPPPDRVLSHKEEAQLLAACDKPELQCRAPHLKSIILVALHAGLRRGEILRLRWADVDLQQGVLVVRKSKTRSGRGRRVNLNSMLRRMLFSLHDEERGEWVFPSPKRFQTPGEPERHIGDVKNAFRRAVRLAGIAPITFHQLRHTFCSRLADAGIPLPVIQDLAGHASIMMTRRYTHPSEDLKQRAVELLLTGQNGVPPATQPATGEPECCEGQKTEPASEAKRIRSDGRPVRARTADLHRVKVTLLGFTTTYKTAGTAKVRGSHTRHRVLWVGLWVRNAQVLGSIPTAPTKSPVESVAFASREPQIGA